MTPIETRKIKIKKIRGRQSEMNRRLVCVSPINGGNQRSRGFDKMGRPMVQRLGVESRS